jgi:hypothetical protein
MPKPNSIFAISFTIDSSHQDLSQKMHNFGKYFWETKINKRRKRGKGEFAMPVKCVLKIHMMPKPTIFAILYLLPIATFPWECILCL